MTDSTSDPFDWRLTCILCGATDGLILVPQMAGRADGLIGYLSVCCVCRDMFNGADITPRIAPRQED